MPVQLRKSQLDAVENMSNGCILNGGVGTGKSRTSLYYYFKEQGGDWSDEYIPMRKPKNLYIITTARKRDMDEWEPELNLYMMSRHPDRSLYDHIVTVDSWNNIKKYKDVHGAFFIFDEQRLVGSGNWVKTFLNLARKNKWILLSATPGDTWNDYIPVFVANGFFKNKTEMLREHAVYARYSRYPKIEKFIYEDKLERLKESILVNIHLDRTTNRHVEYIYCEYDRLMYKKLTKERWNIYKDKPIEHASELCYTWRKIVNSDYSRETESLKISSKHKKLIIFYNFDYELDILKSIKWNVESTAEWNGHRHETIPQTSSWVYLVQYTAGCEGWNCIETDAILFYSQNYSYKVLEQSMGRIDRMNTEFTDLYYYMLTSKSPIDLGIHRAIRQKKRFNETNYVNKSV